MSVILLFHNVISAGALSSFSRKSSNTAVASLRSNKRVYADSYKEICE